MPQLSVEPNTGTLLSILKDADADLERRSVERSVGLEACH